MLAQPLGSINAEDMMTNGAFASYVADVGFGVAYPNTASFWNKFPATHHVRTMLAIMLVWVDANILSTCLWI